MSKKKGARRDYMTREQMDELNRLYALGEKAKLWAHKKDFGKRVGGPQNIYHVMNSQHGMRKVVDGMIRKAKKALEEKGISVSCEQSASLPRARSARAVIGELETLLDELKRTVGSDVNGNAPCKSESVKSTVAPPSDEAERLRWHIQEAAKELRSIVEIEDLDQRVRVLKPLFPVINMFYAVLTLTHDELTTPITELLLTQMQDMQAGDFPERDWWLEQLEKGR